MSRNHDATAPVAVTMGEPAGIGPEITGKCWQSQRSGLPPFFVIGDPALYTGAGVTVVEIDQPGAAAAVYADALPVLPLPLAEAVIAGEPTSANAKSVLQSIENAVSFARTGDASAVVTNPIHKSVLYAAGFKHPGHTELLAALCERPSEDAVMLLAAADLRVVPVTIHVPLSTVAHALSSERIVAVTRIVHRELIQRFAISSPRIAVAALNPHAGESGKFGDEEAEIITPAVHRLRSDGLDVSGPWPADTLFHERARTKHDVVICMYHDQALIPLKTIDFDRGVNVTLGLPIIRTSPDHGTALDIAGTNRARADSLSAAIRLAGKLASHEHDGID